MKIAFYAYAIDAYIIDCDIDRFDLLKLLKDLDKRYEVKIFEYQSYDDPDVLADDLIEYSPDVICAISPVRRLIIILN